MVLILLILTSVSVYADLCSDTDGGPTNINSPSDSVLATKGTVEYGITDKVDVCVTSPTGVSIGESAFLQEYYCDNDKRESKVYTCSDYGFTGCEGGKCVGKNATQGNQSNQSSQPSPPTAVCGNEITEKDGGEECDPPGSVCFGADISEYGQCTDSCTCKLANAVQTKCGNGEIDEGETCEVDGDCGSGKVCKKCLCVTPATNTTNTSNTTTGINTSQSSTNTSSSSEVSANQTTKKKNRSLENITAQIDQKYPDPNVTPVDIGEVKNFSEDPAIRTTGAVSRFFSGIWDWITSLFS